MKIGTCSFADDVIYYPDGHLWIRPGERIAVVGTDIIMAWLAGKITNVTVQGEGVTVEPGHRLASLEGPRHFDVVRTPVKCRVTSVNKELSSRPNLVNKDPYGRGWLAEVEIEGSNLASPLLKSIGEAAPTFERMINQIGIRCFSEFPDYELYEIGTECSAVLVQLNELLSASEPGTVVHIVSDDPTAEVELIRWSEQTGNRMLESRVEANLRHFLIKKL